MLDHNWRMGASVHPRCKHWYPFKALKGSRQSMLMHNELFIFKSSSDANERQTKDKPGGQSATPVAPSSWWWGHTSQRQRHRQSCAKNLAAQQWEATSGQHELGRPAREHRYRPVCLVLATGVQRQTATYSFLWASSLS